MGLARASLRPISVFACESQPVVVEGLAKVLASSEDFEFAGSVGRIGDAFDTLCRVRPDISLLDLTSGLAPALRLVGNLKTAAVSCQIVLWVVDLPEMDAFRALQMGVRGIVKKTLPVAKLARVPARSCRRQRLDGRRAASRRVPTPQ